MDIVIIIKCLEACNKEDNSHDVCVCVGFTVVANNVIEICSMVPT